MHISNVLNSFYSFVSVCEDKTHATPQSITPVSATNSAILRLPTEIISLILESAYYDDNLDPDLKSLSSCALVCRQWAAPSQSLLFRHVSLRSSSAFLSFRSAVDNTLAGSRTLGSLVVRLQVVIDHNHPDQLSHRALALAVFLCPNLYELDIAVYGCSVPGSVPDGAAGAIRIFRAAPSFDAGILDFLRDGPPIRSLKFANWTDNDQLAFQLLSDVWPSLTAISLKGTPPRLPVIEDEPILPFTCNLSELRFGFQNAPNKDLVEWLLMNSTRSLRCLELERIPGTTFLATLIQQCGLSLDSLALPSCISRDQVSVVQGCENLKEFRFESTAVSPVLLKQLPSSLEHLAFAVSRDTPLYLVVNFVKARRNLRAITVHVWDDGEAHPQMPSLKIACACNDVELLLMRNIHRFRATSRGDPVAYSASYPRVKAPNNLRKMLCISRRARCAAPIPKRPQRRTRASSAAAVLSHQASPEISPENAVVVIGSAIGVNAHREK